MKKVLVWGIIIFNLVFFSQFNLYKANPSYESKEEACESIKGQNEPCEIANTQEIMNKLVKESEIEESTEEFEITYDEAQMLMKIAMAEAEIDGVEGQAMVMAVILNRVADERFPNTIEEVILQENQFSPISDGRYFESVPDENSHLALAEIEKGNYKDIDALYFENASNSWQSKNCIYLGTVGHHRFYK